jgi:hypothetical protein
MIRKLLPLIMGLMLLTAAAAMAAPAEPRLPLEPAGPESNLLVNPSFEGEYHAYVPPPPGHPDCNWGVCNTAQMADGWTPYWRSHSPDDPDWIIRMPEYKPASPIFTDPVRVRSGEAAQQYFTFYSTHEAGFYQRVAVTPGVAYRFSVWGHSWSAEDDDDAYSGPQDGVLNQRVGIDPTGGTDWQSPAIVWGPQRTQYDYYGLFEIEAVAQAPYITVYTYSQPMWAVKHNDVYWDDAALVPVTTIALVVDPAGPQGLVAEVDSPWSAARSLTIQVSGDPSYGWQAGLAPGGSLNPALSTTSGPSGASLVVTINSSGYPVGTYNATLVLATDPPLPGIQVEVPLYLIVVEDFQRTYLPRVMKP